MPGPLDEEMVRRLAESYERQQAKRAAYNKQRYYKKRYGADIKSAFKEFTFNGVKLVYGQPLETVQAVLLPDGKHHGVPGWYFNQGGNEWRHVRYGEDLITRGHLLPTCLHRFITPSYGVNSATAIGATEQRDIISALRLVLSWTAASNWYCKVFTECVEQLPVSALLGEIPREFYSANTRQWEINKQVYRLYFESIDLMHVAHLEDFNCPVQSVIDRYRISYNEIQAMREQREQRATTLRQRVAEEFGYKFDADAQHYTIKKGGHQVTIKLDSQVHIDNRYVCIVPVNGGHRNDRHFLGDDSYPMGDIIAAKMIAVATDDPGVSTLRAHTTAIRSLFQ